MATISRSHLITGTTMSFISMPLLTQLGKKEKNSIAKISLKSNFCLMVGLLFLPALLLSIKALISGPHWERQLGA